jgi:DNA-binding PadR family transcriptional regulator
MFRNNFQSDRRPRERLFEKGDLKYVILDLIKEKPSHGYEIMQALKDHFHGMYSPSAGSVYPTLQMLEDLGYVKATEQDGKKIYTVTEEGMNFLKQRGDTVDRIKNHMHGWCGSGHRADIQEIFEGFHDLGRTVGSQAHDLSAEKIDKIKEVLNNARKGINDILRKEVK